MSEIPNFAWPPAGDREAAQLAMRMGRGLAMFVTVISVLVGIARIGLEVLPELPSVAPWVNAVAFAGIGYGLHRESRLAASIGLALAILGGIFGGSATWVSILLVVVFLGACRGAFVLASIRGTPSNNKLQRTRGGSFGEQ